MQAKLEKANVQDIFELSMIQRGMLFHYLREVSENLYNVQLTLKIEGDLEESLFKNALELVQKNNEVLRSIFSWEKLNKPYQIILKEHPLDYSSYDLSEESSKKTQEFIDEFLIQDQQKRFDLNLSLFRVCLIKESTQSFIFILTHHHILYDGWSTGILMKEIFGYYKEFNGKVAIQTVEKPTYKEIQFQIKKSKNLEKETSYWSNYLKDFEIQLLLSKISAKSEDTQRIQKIHVSSPIDKIEAFVANNKITKAALIYAAYGLLLQKYSHTSDVVFGTVISNRDAAIGGIERVVGNFINTIPFRLKYNELLSLLGIAEQVNKELITRNQFCGTSYFEIKQLLELSPKENLYDSVVVVENYPIDETLIKNHPDLSISLKSVYENSDLPLLTSIFFKENLEFEVTFKECMVEASFVKKFIGHWIKILNEIIEYPNKKINEINLLSTSEKHRHLIEFNNTKVNYPNGQTVVDLFEEQSKRVPNNLAITCNGETLSYQQLNQKADKMAAYLVNIEKVKSGDLIGILLDRSVELVVTILGILKAGAAYIPIDINYPIHRITTIIADAKLQVLISKNNYSNLIEAEDIVMVDIETKREIIESQKPIKINVKENDLAYLIYTSGSTGNPKGVMIEHRSLLNYSRSSAKNYMKEEGASFAFFSSISFDLTVTSIFTPLISGNSIIVYEDDSNNLLIEKVIADGNASIVKMTPTHLKFIRDSQSISSLSEKIKTFIIGGENLETQLVKDIYKKFGDQISIFNEYGPTEATVGCMIHKYHTADDHFSVPIGVPFDNCQIYLLDKNLQPVPEEMKGEIYIGGSCLARGYLFKSELTAEKFIQNPFLEEQKMYKTGDFGIRLANGNIVYKGRIDEQVKIRGHRIELKEIEKYLLDNEQIKEVVILAKVHGEEKCLVAYFVSNTSFKVGELSNYLSPFLPSYMIPTYFIQVDEMPVTTNGKLNKKALPEPEFSISFDHQLPVNRIEEELLKIWSDILNIPTENISTNQSFFELGGHSLKATVLVNKIQKGFGFKIPLSEIFNNDTIGNLSDYLITVKQLDVVSEIPNENMEIVL